MALATPGIGLIFWTFLIFVIVIVLLGKFAWKPILTAVNERNDSIDRALKSAEEATAQMKKLQSGNKALLKKAQAEKDQMMKDAKKEADRIIFEASEKATAESNRILKAAQEEIQAEKNAALTEVKKEVAQLSLTIAEKLIREQLKDDATQTKLVAKFMEETKLN